MIKENRLIFSVNGNELTFNEIKEWEIKRLAATHKYLNKKANAKFEKNFSALKKNKDINAMRNEIVNAKMELGFDQIRNVMKKRYTIGNAMSMIAEKLSFGKRKFSIAEIFVPNSSLNPEQVMASINQIMMEKNENHDFMNISSNPDHYVLQGITSEVQEVLELTGGSPLPTRFFAHYYDESKLKSKKSSDYDIELPGVAKLNNGTIIGGMRHQIKKENDGFRFKALVEFPGILPNSMIRQHQMHLACEFGHWISFVLEEDN
ncbi:hypothetical protein [Staphylococcus shinii]|uniref:hypothetical protein n=2 Tax=Staphylococcus shinii TaxID=2912228 RepID=UPI00057BDA9C|nr:hypothetical protein [Staphylococcus shinii]MBO3065758.1 hypothetical protein [Staphylococcus shinii]OEK88101.1 hypothetical protein AST15_07275 [Staphylococcus shinii]PTH98309.1 hypothetical protein BU114_10680 [Staphylococcus shinii]QRA16330.1 hypothetical protein JMB28_11930 [Staphylococcus shinii]RIM95654.1 hypothetical protein BU113_11555 [Staphylococcus shinii]